MQGDNTGMPDNSDRASSFQPWHPESGPNGNWGSPRPVRPHQASRVWVVLGGGAVGVIVVVVAALFYFSKGDTEYTVQRPTTIGAFVLDGPANTDQDSPYDSTTTVLLSRVFEGTITGGFVDQYERTTDGVEMAVNVATGTGFDTGLLRSGYEQALRETGNDPPELVRVESPHDGPAYCFLDSGFSGCVWLTATAFGTLGFQPSGSNGVTFGIEELTEILGDVRRAVEIPA